MDATIGVDIGGTTTRIALVAADGAVRACEHAPTASFCSYSTLLRWVGEISDALILESGSPVTALGVAVPGILDASRTRVARSINVPLLEDRDIGGHLVAMTGLRVGVFTDADAATWGEWAAIHPAVDRFAHLRLGTGVACGVVVDGARQSLERQAGRHADVLIVEHGDSAAECRCGNRGCLEAIASGAALSREVSALGYAASLKLLRSRESRLPDELETLRHRAMRGVETAIGNLARCYGVDVVALGGGVIEALPEMFRALTDRHETETESSTGAPMVRRALLGDEAGVIGAAIMARSSPHST